MRYKFNFDWLIDWKIEFNGMVNFLGLFLY